VLIAALLCILAVLVVIRVDRQETPRLTVLQAALMLCGALLAAREEILPSVHRQTVEASAGDPSQPQKKIER
jgi:hypothetical protein